MTIVEMLEMLRSETDLLQCDAFVVTFARSEGKWIGAISLNDVAIHEAALGTTEQEMCQKLEEQLRGRVG